MFLRVLPIFTCNRWQKTMQLDLEEHQLLMDVTCLWLYILPLLKDAVSPEYMDKVDEMWENGLLGCKASLKQKLVPHDMLPRFVSSC